MLLHDREREPLEAALRDVEIHREAHRGRERQRGETREEPEGEPRGARELGCDRSRRVDLILIGRREERWRQSAHWIGQRLMTLKIVWP